MKDVSPRMRRVLPESFLALATGGGGTRVMAELKAAQFDKHRVLLAAVVQISQRRRDVADAYALLADLEDATPRAVHDVVGYPAVGMWAAQVLRQEADPGRMSAVALAAAFRAGQECRLPVTAHDGWVTLPSLGGFPARGTRLVGVGGEGVLADGRPVTGWQAVTRIESGDQSMVIDDLDPYRWVGDLTRLDGGDTWSRLLSEAWRLLIERHQTSWEEIRTGIGMLTPISAPAGRPRSESSKYAFGAIALSRPADAVSLAETLVHETQHVKFHALNDLVRLVEPGHQGRYYAPWRPDPRPALGLLNGTYAFLGVTGFWRRMRHAADERCAHRAEVEFAQWREAVYEAACLLLSGSALTPAGAEFAEGMAGTLRRWIDEPVESWALARAREMQAARRAAWERRNDRSAQAAG
ncbi:HEXXH motif domain-containing protein [Herbidospora galbida]|uniref:HEXXH motif domain-containing protein n=1 Tax=Herbidospora galbida TaxID=2575442 RepID=A0A4U3MJ06_9ACTN|nr:HEXXH motif domain-containing protein [Herbidospora galbida]TKK89311.1 HEXXH motif domain-containing protein [Herbidospora galbida]